MVVVFYSVYFSRFEIVIEIEEYDVLHYTNKIVYFRTRGEKNFARVLNVTFHVKGLKNAISRC